LGKLVGAESTVLTATRLEDEGEITSLRCGRKLGCGDNLKTHILCVKTCFRTNRQTEPQGSFNSEAVLAAPARERRQAVLFCALAGVSGAARLSLLFCCAGMIFENCCH